MAPFPFWVAICKRNIWRKNSTNNFPSLAGGACGTCWIAGRRGVRVRGGATGGCHTKAASKEFDFSMCFGYALLFSRMVQTIPPAPAHPNVDYMKTLHSISLFHDSISLMLSCFTALKLYSARRRRERLACSRILRFPQVTVFPDTIPLATSIHETQQRVEQLLSCMIRFFWPLCPPCRQTVTLLVLQTHRTLDRALSVVPITTKLSDPRQLLSFQASGSPVRRVKKTTRKSLPLASL